MFWNGFPSPTQGSEGVDSHKSLYGTPVQCPEIKESNSLTVFPDRLFPAEEGWSHPYKQNHVEFELLWGDVEEEP